MHQAMEVVQMQEQTMALADDHPAVDKIPENHLQMEQQMHEVTVERVPQWYLENDLILCRIRPMMMKIHLPSINSNNHNRLIIFQCLSLLQVNHIPI